MDIEEIYEPQINENLGKLLIKKMNILFLS